MKSFHDQKVLSEYRNWLTSSLHDRGGDNWFITLTLKQGIERDDGTWECLTLETAETNVCWFLKNLNNSIFGNAHKRYGKRLVVIDAAEGAIGSGQRLHRHMIIQKPDRLTDNEFQIHIRETWLKSRWGYRKIDIQRARDIGAVASYITKTGGDAICLATTSL